jgi:hypothetical protein
MAGSVCVSDARVFHKVGATARVDAATDLVLSFVIGGLLFASKHLPVPIALLDVDADQLSDASQRCAKVWRN